MLENLPILPFMSSSIQSTTTPPAFYLDTATALMDTLALLLIPSSTWWYNRHANILEVTIIPILMAMFETLRPSGSITKEFRLRDTSEWTLSNFKAKVNCGNKERLCMLNTGPVGYHSIHAAIHP
jgi:hypothetical protein